MNFNAGDAATFALILATVAGTFWALKILPRITVLLCLAAGGGFGGLIGTKEQEAITWVRDHTSSMVGTITGATVSVLGLAGLVALIVLIKNLKPKTGKPGRSLAPVGLVFPSVASTIPFIGGTVATVLAAWAGALAAVVGWF